MRDFQLIAAFTKSLVVACGLFCCATPADAQVERFKPREGNAIEVRRIANDPTVRDHANYHNTQCWSPDGRYICYTRHGSRLDRNRRREQDTVYIHDLAKNETRLVGQGHSPRWARRHNWLFYAHGDPADGPTYEQGAEVRRLDVDTGVQTRICYRLAQAGKVSSGRSGIQWHRERGKCGVRGA